MTWTHEQVKTLVDFHRRHRESEPEAPTTPTTQPLTADKASESALALASWIKRTNPSEFDIAVAIDAYTRDELRQVIERATSNAQQPAWPLLPPFAQRMAAELQANSHKGHWRGSDEAALFNEVLYHVDKLRRALFRGEGNPLEYAADVANICMMLVDNRGLLQQPDPDDDATPPGYHHDDDPHADRESEALALIDRPWETP